MKPAEKLKRIKLISEQIFINGYTQIDSKVSTSIGPKTCIALAVDFINQFEKFETEFLKEHGVKGEN